jgi:uncharacterized protein YlxP (DUF503 family)
MIIGCLVMDIYLPYSHSLKEKRKRLKPLQDRLKSRHNVAVSELEFQDKWQRSRLGIVTLNSSRGIVEKTLNLILRDAEDMIEGEIVSADITYV